MGFSFLLSSSSFNAVRCSSCSSSLGSKSIESESNPIPTAKKYGSFSRSLMQFLIWDEVMSLILITVPSLILHFVTAIFKFSMSLRCGVII